MSRPLRRPKLVEAAFAKHAGKDGNRLQHRRELHFLTVNILSTLNAASEKPWYDEAHGWGDIEKKVQAASAGGLDWSCEDFSMWLFREFDFSDKVDPEDGRTEESLFAQTLKSGSGELKILTVTWNVGNKMPNGFGCMVPRGSVSDFDIIAVGAQECSYTAKHAKGENPPDTAVYLDGSSQPLHDWFGQIVEYLGEGWVPVKSNELWQMRLIVFARKALADSISSVETSKEATGIAHVCGNKGGIVVRFEICGTSFAFISAHLAAHEGVTHRQQRNQNVEEILEGVRLGERNDMDIVCQTDHVFWMGDLNYRLDLEKVGLVKHKEGATKEDRAAVQYGIVMDMVNKEEWNELWPADELTKEIEDGHVFLGFKEGTYHFPPTFKVVRDELHEWNPTRTPSWCDRVLWRSHPDKAAHVHQDYFSGVPEVLTSDHKPVISSFTVQIPTGAAAEANAMQCPDIWVSGLRCTNLTNADTLSKSDPFVEFYAPDILAKSPSGKHVTSEIMDNLNPAWEDVDVPIMRTRIADAKLLATKHMLLAVFDVDVGSKNDLLGWAWVPLKDGNFDEPLFLNGKAAGSVAGQVSVQFPNPDGTRQERQFEKKSHGCAAHCTVL